MWSAISLVHLLLKIQPELRIEAEKMQIPKYQVFRKQHSSLPVDIVIKSFSLL